MKRSLLPSNHTKETELIATFGAAKIVEHLDGTMDIEGGSEEDRRQALEWADMFLGDFGKKRRK